MHDVVTPHVCPTAIALPAHAVVPYVAPPAAEMLNAVAHIHTGAVPLHVPATSHVYGAAAVGVNPPLHEAVTVHVSPTAIVLPAHAVVVYVAPLAAVMVSPVLQAHTGAVPLHVPAVA